MKFDDLDVKMRVFETAHDLCALPGLYLVARIDGRNFTRLTKDVIAFETPFDERFRDYMIGTTEHVMNCGFRAIYGYTQSDEVSVAFHRDEGTFDRKLRKFDSILAGEASAKFSNLLGHVASFDCRISQLPRIEDVTDYFRWRQEDAHRNALNAHCYWQLRKTGETVKKATAALVGLSTSEKNELLFDRGINFNRIPNWQKRGTGVYWETFTKKGFNPKLGKSVAAARRRLKVDMELPMKASYAEFVRRIIGAA